MTNHPLSQKFRGYYPVVVDIETGGLDPQQHTILDIAAITLTLDKKGKLVPLKEYQTHVYPHPDYITTPEALKINKINLKHLEFSGVSEKQALQSIFKPIRAAQTAHDCKQSILVGHNAFFDLAFINAAAKRSKVRRNPFHQYSTLDTVTLSGVMLGHTVLVKACELAGISFDRKQAHTALYDAQKTAQLFCSLVNKAWGFTL